MEMTMISRGIEISMAGGVEETKDGNLEVNFFFSFFFFFLLFFKSYVHCF